MTEEKKLYIPVPIKRKKEIAEGIGIGEVFKIAVLVGIGLGIGFLLFLFLKEIYFLILPPVFFLMFGIIFYKKDATNKNVIDRIKEMLSFIQNQKKYYYKYNNIYEEGGNETIQRKKEK